MKKELRNKLIAAETEAAWSLVHAVENKELKSDSWKIAAEFLDAYADYMKEETLRLRALKIREQNDKLTRDAGEKGL